MKKLIFSFLTIAVLATISNAQTTTVVIDANNSPNTISRHIYGHFSEHLGRCIYAGGWFADEYHWRDGIGPRKERPYMVNTNWGGVTEDNSFGTHEFLELCSLIGCEPYIAGNVGSGTVEEMAKWVEYLNSDAKSTM